MLARVSLVLVITIAAGRGAAQGIASPVFDGAGQIDPLYVNPVTVDAEGNLYYAGGESTGMPGDWLDFDPGPGVVPLNEAATQQMFFIAKVDPERNLQWLKSVPASLDNIFISEVHVDAQGNVIVLGYVGSMQSIDFGEPGNPLVVNLPESSRIIWKLDADGTTLWVQALSSSVPLNEARTAADGSLYLLGYQGSTSDLDPGPGVFQLPSNGLSPVLLKLTADGIFAWAKLFPETGDEWAGHTLTIGTDGLLYLALRFNGQIDADPGPGTQLFVTNPLSDTDMLLVCLNASGNLEWATQDGRELQDIALDGAGGLLLWNFDLVTRYSVDGALLWTREIGNPASSGLYGIAAGDDSDFYMVGVVHGFGDNIGTSPADMSNFTVTPPNRGVYVARWDLGGTQLWCTMLGPAPNAFIPPIEIFATENRLRIATAFRTQADFDPSSTSHYFMTPYTSQGTTDMAFVTLAGSDELWVDFDLTTPRPMDGSQAYPLRTLDNAIRAIQPGQTINLKSTGAGVELSDTGSYSKAMTLRAVGGSARIGVQP